MNKEKRRHTESLILRLTPEQKELIKQAADKKQLDLSGWIRMILIEAAQKEIGSQ